MVLLEEFKFNVQEAENKANSEMISPILAVVHSFAKRANLKFTDIDQNTRFNLEEKESCALLSTMSDRFDLFSSEFNSVYTNTQNFFFYAKESGNFQFIGWTTREKLLEVSEEDFNNGNKYRKVFYHALKQMNELFKIEVEEVVITRDEIQPFCHLHLHTEFSVGDGYGSAEMVAEEMWKKGFDSCAITDHGTLAGTYYLQKTLKAKNIKPILGYEAYITDSKNTISELIERRNRLFEEFKIQIASEKAIMDKYGDTIYTNTEFTDEEKKIIEKIKSKKKKKKVTTYFTEELEKQIGLLFEESDELPEYIKELDDEIELAKESGHLTILCKNEIGWKNLLKLHNKGVYENFYYKPRISLTDLLANHEGLVVLSGCTSGYIAKRLALGKDVLETVKPFLEAFKEDFYLEIMPHAKVPFQKELNAKLIELNKLTKIKLVVTCDAHYPNKEDKPIHEAIKAIAYNKKFGEVGFIGNTYYYMQHKEIEDIMLQDFGVPVEKTIEMFANSIEIVNKCNFEIKKVGYETLPQLFENEEQALTDLARQKMKEFGFEGNKVYEDRLTEELERILTKKYTRYFLIVHDYVNFCKKAGMQLGAGRGSVGGSLLAYILGITTVNPIEFNLNFTRFLSPARKDAPDIDLDFPDDRRKEVLEYFKQKYGVNCTAKIGTYSTWHGKGALRDIGRIFSLPPAEVNQICNLVVQRSGGDARADFCLTDTFTEFDKGKEFASTHPEEAKLAIALESKIRHKGAHAAGVILSGQNLSELIPMMRVNDEFCTEWEKSPIEEVGLVKFDILGLSTLTIIKETLDKIEPRPVLPNTFEDPKVYETVFKKGKTLGVFQFETVGLQNLSKKLEIDNFKLTYDATTLYRPGALHSGETASYTMRKQGKEKWNYDHPLLEPITKDTFGLILYQEQVMEVMYSLGGFSWATSESARKIMTKSKGKEAFEKMREEFCVNANQKHELQLEEAGKIFDVVSTFGCLDEHTIIYRASSNQHEKRELKIKDAYKYQNSENFKHRKLKILSMCADGNVRPNIIKNIVYTGEKEVYFIKTSSNKTIKASAEHRFLVNDEWVQVKNTKVGDWIRVTDLTLPKKIYTEGFGSGGYGLPTPNKRKGEGYTNEEKNQIEKLKNKYSGHCQLCGSEKFCEMHHINHSHLDNSDENTMYVCRKCHKKVDKDCDFSRFQKGYYTQNEKITEIKKIGKRKTYDLEMVDAPRNFIANNFVSHNSYGFNKSHAVEYSVISYWCAWLKTYYPAEFFATLLSHQEDSQKIKDYVGDMKEFGLKVCLPDINNSKINYYSKDKNIYAGFGAIKGVGDKVAQKIIDGQPYTDFQDFLTRIKPGIKLIQSLALCGCFDCWKINPKFLVDYAEWIKGNKNFWEWVKDTAVLKDYEQYEEKDLQLLRLQYIDLETGKPLIDLFEDPFAETLPYKKIGSLNFDNADEEVWIKGIITFINFKQEGLEGNWTMFQNILERRYAHLNLSDGTGNVLVHLSPEQYTYYKTTLEKGTGTPVIIKGHTLQNITKIYCDALIVLNDINYNLPIIKYIDGEAQKVLEEVRANLSNYESGIIKSVSYKVSKNKKPYARISIQGKPESFLCFTLSSQVFIAGEVLVYQVTQAPFIRVIARK